VRSPRGSELDRVPSLGRPHVVTTQSMGRLASRRYSKAYSWVLVRGDGVGGWSLKHLIDRIREQSLSWSRHKLPSPHACCTCRYRHLSLVSAMIARGPPDRKMPSLLSLSHADRRTMWRSTLDKSSSRQTMSSKRPRTVLGGWHYDQYIPIIFRRSHTRPSSAC